MNLSHLIVPYLRERFLHSEYSAGVQYNDAKLYVEVTVFLKNPVRIYTNVDSAMCWSRWRATMSPSYTRQQLDIENMVPASLDIHHPDFFENVFQVVLLCLDRRCDECVLSGYVRT